MNRHVAAWRAESSRGQAILTSNYGRFGYEQLYVAAAMDLRVHGQRRAGGLWCGLHSCLEVPWCGPSEHVTSRDTGGCEASGCAGAQELTMTLDRPGMRRMAVVHHAGAGAVLKLDVLMKLDVQEKTSAGSCFTTRPTGASRAAAVRGVQAGSKGPARLFAVSHIMSMSGSSSSSVLSRSANCRISVSAKKPDKPRERSGRGG